MSESEHHAPQTQRTMFLMPFACDLPLLHTPDGDFVPLVALCDMLGLPTSPYTALACKRFRPEGALRRLLFQDDPYGPPRPVWCIREEKVIPWLWSVPSERVSPARREQLQDFHRQSVEVANQLYTIMQQQYRVSRAEVFDWLLMCEEMSARLQRVAERPAPRLHPNHRAELNALLAQGHTLLEESATRARAVVQEMTRQPVLDTVEVDAEGEVVVIGSMPLLPMLPSLPLLKQSQERTAAWFHEFNAFLKAHLLL